MTHKKSNLKALAVLAVIAIAVVLVVEVYLPNVPKQDILAVSKINLEQHGVAGSDGALKGGDWRITATSGSADSYFLQLNQSTLSQYQSTYPSDVQITGSTTFGAFQTYNPFWYLPVTKVKDVTVYPKISGSYKLNQDTAHTVPPMVVTVWQTVPSQMQLQIPFSIGILKTFGSNLGSFTTNYPSAKLESSANGLYYDFSISAESIASGNLTNTIVFTNPNDSHETVKITLQFTVNSAYQFPTEPWVIVTEQNGGEVSNNVFHYSDLQTILNVLDYSQGNAWSYYHYLYGGGSVFRGHGHTSFGSAAVPAPGVYPLSSWGDGSVAPIFGPVATPPYGSFYYMIDEGYSYPKTDTNQNFDFPGWYVPSPDNNEGLHLGSDYWNYRLPIAGALHNDLQNTTPTMLSIVDYLTQALTYQNQVKPFTLEQIKSPQGVAGPNYWGYGGQGSCPAGIGVAIPKGARQWLFTLDVSTEAVDSIVVVQNYIDVAITNFNVDRESIGKDQTATVTATLRNNSPFAGSVSVGVNIPASLSYSVTTAGGTGLMHFDASGSAQFTFTITNIGNFVADTGPQTLTLTVTNTEPRVTASKDFQLNFLKGLGVPDTTIKATTQDADTNAVISGLTVQVFYGQTMTESTSSMATQDGSATFDLGVYTGYAKVVVTDNRGMYQDQDKTIGPLTSGSNPVTFAMVLKGTPTTNNWTTLIIVAAVIVIILIAAAILAKKHH